MDYDKSVWPPGPWHEEPDRLEWRSEGLPCLIVRNRLGALCGYVGVSEGHPWHGKSADEIEASAHGGLTYAAACEGHICHVPLPGEPDSVWWVGFDCLHGGDEAPGMLGRGLGFGGTYRSVFYVRGEVEALAKQARGAE